jgi:hypothetical protein
MLRVFNPQTAFALPAIRFLTVSGVVVERWPAVTVRSPLIMMKPLIVLSALIILLSAPSFLPLSLSPSPSSSLAYPSP